MFSISPNAIDGIPTLLLSNGTTELELIPSKGATINRLQLTTENGQQSSILTGAKDLADLDRPGLFRGVQMMPFANRVKDGKYSFEGEEYRMPINEVDKNNALHGFVWDAPFTLVEQSSSATAEGCTVLLSYEYRGGFDGYPFFFEFQVEYKLNHCSFACAYTVKNVGERTMPFSMGWHPYFQFAGEDIDELYLRLPKVIDIPLDRQMVPVGDPAPYEKREHLSKIGEEHFDNCYRIEEEGVDATVVLASKAKETAIYLKSSTGPKGLGYLQVYSPPDRKSIAIEPMTSCVDAFNNGKGLVTLKKNTTFTTAFEVSVAPWQP